MVTKLEPLEDRLFIVQYFPIGDDKRDHFEMKFPCDSSENSILPLMRESSRPVLYIHPKNIFLLDKSSGKKSILISRLRAGIEDKQGVIYVNKYNFNLFEEMFAYVCNQEGLGYKMEELAMSDSKHEYFSKLSKLFEFPHMISSFHEVFVKDKQQN